MPAFTPRKSPVNGHIKSATSEPPANPKKAAQLRGSGTPDIRAMKPTQVEPRAMDPMQVAAIRPVPSAHSSAEAPPESIVRLLLTIIIDPKPPTSRNRRLTVVATVNIKGLVR